MSSLRTYLTGLNAWGALKEKERKLPSPIRRALYRTGLRKFPYEEHNDKLQCVFIHIPKTAGSSIVRAIGAGGARHIAADSFEVADPYRFNAYFKFTFVRNPWDRFVSAFAFLQRQQRRQGVARDTLWANRNMGEDSFERFVLRLRDPRFAADVLRFVHFVPQHQWISGAPMDFIGRYENLDHDFSFVAARLGIGHELGHVRKSEHLPYEDIMTEEMKGIVYKLYEVDFEKFGY